MQEELKEAKKQETEKREMETKMVSSFILSGNL